jgi:hypothetical protein
MSCTIILKLLAGHGMLKRNGEAVLFVWERRDLRGISRRSSNGERGRRRREAALGLIRTRC